MLAPDKAPAFPSEATPVAGRSKDYYLAFAKAFYYDFTTRQRVPVFYNQRSLYARNRSYSLGMQDVNQYKKRLDTEDRTHRYVELDYSILPVWPKFRDIILSRMAARYCDVVATPIDAVSQEQEQSFRHQQLATIQNQDVAQGLAGVGVDVGQGPTLPEGVMQQVPMDQPQTPEELELFMQMAYKSRRAMAVEIATDVVFYDNDWKEVARQMREDLLDCGVGVSKNYVDPASGRIRLRRCDPAWCLSGWSSRSDFRYVTRFGELVPMTMAEVVAAGGLDDTQQDHLKAFAGNQSRYGWSYQGAPGPAGLADAGRFLVADMEWLGKDALNTVYRNGALVGPAPADYVLQEGETLKTTDFEQVFRCKWVVGTDVVFDYGVAPDQARDRSRPAEGQLSFTVYGLNMQDMKALPYTSRVTPVADDYQLARLKIQHLVTTARQDGVAIEYGSLNGVLKGDGTEFEPLELLRIFDQTGNMIYNRIDLNGDPMNGRPVEVMPGTPLNAVLNLFQVCNFHLDQLRLVTGLNEAADASTPGSNALNGTTQNALQNANLALQPLYDADDVLLERTARSIVARLQSGWRDYTGKPWYVESMGKMVLRTLEEDPGMSLAEFGIKIEARPGDQLRQQLEQLIQTAVATRATTGQGGIEPSTAQVIRRLAESNIKLAEQYLVLREKKQRQEDMQQASQRSQMNAQEQQQSIAANSQAELEKLRLMAQIELEKQKQLNELAKDLDNHKTQNIISVKQAEGMMKMQNTDLQGDIDSELVNKQIKLTDVRGDRRGENIADGPGKIPSQSGSSKK